MDDAARIVVAARSAAPERCPVCHADLRDGAALGRCDGCGTAVHDGCRRELGGCPTLGCARAAPRRPRPRPAAPGPWARAWASALALGAWGARGAARLRAGGARAARLGTRLATWLGVALAAACVAGFAGSTLGDPALGVAILVSAAAGLAAFGPRLDGR